MANVVVVLDKDAERRASYVAAVRPRISPVAGLVLGECEGEAWTAVWAAAPTAPVSCQTDSTGGAVVWGDAIDETGQRQTAAGVRSAWREDATATWDGYFAAVTAEGAGRLTVGADVLGVFPIYYWQGPGVVLVGTSAELFAAHPTFRAQLDVAGLVGVLLTNGLVGGTTLWTGVRRLGAGHQLRVRDGAVTTIETYRVPEEPTEVGLPLAGHAALLGDALAAAVRRHAPPGPGYGLLLSGGLDSRMLAGLLCEQGTTVRALTFGRWPDIELACARKVAAALDLDLDTAEVPAADFPAAAEALARWEGLAAGFNGVPEWGMHPFLARLPSRVVVGHLLDAVAGGSHVSWAFGPTGREPTFDRFFERVTAWGFTPRALREMLAPPARDLVGDVIAVFRAAFESYSDQPHLQAWRCDLRHRQRFHVGSALWVASFGSWPVAPALDRRVLEVAASLPASSLADRRAEIGVVKTRFPRLATLPLDRNSEYGLPLQPRLRHHLGKYARDRLAWTTRALGFGRLARERRYYWWRTYDLDSPGWRAVRDLVEPYRGDLPAPLEREVVSTVLPPAGQPLSLANSITGSSGLKSLLGLALLNREHRFG